MLSKRAGLVLIALALVLAQAQAQQTDSTPLTFEQMLLLATESPSVALAEGRLELARRQLEAASSLVSAELSTGYSQSWSALTDEGIGGTTRSSEGGLDHITLRATVNVVPMGPHAASVQQAQWDLEQASNDLRDARAAALIDTATLYLAALSDTQEVAVQGARVALAQSNLDATRARLEVGAANEANLLAAEIALSQAQNDQAEAEQALAQTLAQLSHTLGATITSVAGEPPDASAPEIADADTLLANRSDVRSAAIGMLEARQNRDSAVRDALPSASLDLGYASASGGQQWQLGTSFDTASFQPSLSASYDPSYSATGGSSRSFTVTIGAAIPLSTATPANLEAAALTIEQSERHAAQTLELARLELAGAFSEVGTAAARTELAERLVTQSERALADARERYDLGLVSILDVQQAEVDLLEAQVQATEARSSHVLAVMRLAQTLALNPSEVF